MPVDARVEPVIPPPPPTIPLDRAPRAFDLQKPTLLRQPASANKPTLLKKPGTATRPEMPRVSTNAPPPMRTRPPSVRPLVTSTLAVVADRIAGRTISDRFKIEELIGQGSTGLVFQAEDLQRGARVALKLIDPSVTGDEQRLQRFTTEALAPQRIDSENVVRVLDAGITKLELPAGITGPAVSLDVPFVAMELLYGVDLRQHLLESGPMRPPVVVPILAQVAHALDRAHAVGIVHRDLKPANLFLTRRSDGALLIKILDFGTAQLSDSPVVQGFHGTPWYMAPEQIDGAGARAASDRWALGLIAFRLLTGESYWAPRPFAEMLTEILVGPVRPASEVVERRNLAGRSFINGNFDAWFFRACATDPKARFLTAGDQIKSLAAALEV